MAGAARAHPPAAGFTLLELVVVLLILAIILSLVGVRLTRERADVVRDEAERLAALLQNVRQQAILESRPYGFAPTEEGYLFLELDDRFRLVPARGDALLRERLLPPRMRLAPLEPAPEDARAGHGSDAARDIVLFDPSGDFAVFTLRLESDGIVWYVRGHADGRIHSTPLLDPAAG